MGGTFVGGEVATTGTTWVEVVAAPASSHQRQVFAVNVCNRDSTSRTISIRVYKGSTGYQTLPDLVLAAGLCGSWLQGIALDATDESVQVKTDATAATTEPLVSVDVLDVSA